MSILILFFHTINTRSGEVTLCIYYSILVFFFFFFPCEMLDVPEPLRENVLGLQDHFTKMNLIPSELKFARVIDLHA